MIKHLLFESHPAIIIFVWIGVGFLSGLGTYAMIHLTKLAIKSFDGILFALKTRKKGLSVCNYCSGFGFIRNRARSKVDCEYCNGKGVVDWPQQIKNGG